MRRHIGASKRNIERHYSMSSANAMSMGQGAHPKTAKTRGES